MFAEAFTSVREIERSKVRLYEERILFIVYLIVVLICMSRHELWGDELHSWNIAKGSGSYIDLIRNRRYEGHPPAWYTVLWVISKFSHRLIYMKLAQLFFISAAVFVFIFYSPFPFRLKAFTVFGYYFIFEFAVFSRNYAVGLLPCFLLCVVLNKDFKGKNAIYYLLLFWMSETHLLAAALAGCIHLYFLMSMKERGKKQSEIVTQAAVGALVLLPSLYFVVSPSDGELDTSFWLSHWHAGQLAVVAQMPLRSFLPMPAWQNSNFWNTEFLIEMIDRHRIMKLICPLFSAVIVGTVFYILSEDRKATILFGMNLFLSAVISCIYTLATARYVGYIFIGFIVASWLHYHNKPIAAGRTKLIAGLLAVQIAAGVYACAEDFVRPFSKMYTVKEIIKKVPAGERVVTDYWTLNAISAYMDEPFYCIDLQKNASLILWDSNMKIMGKNPYRYTSGVDALFEKEKISRVYMISTDASAALMNMDAHLFQHYRVSVVAQSTGSIEKGSNIYLYLIAKKPV